MSIRRMSGLLFATTILLSLLACTDKSGKQVNVFNWAEYIGATTNQDFTSATSIKVNYSLFASNEELLSKLLAAPGVYDVVFPSDYAVRNMIEKGMLEEINPVDVPNLKNLAPKFSLGKLPFDPQGKYAVPYHFGTCGFGYNSKKISSPIRTFKDLLRPELKGRVMVLDDMRYVVGAALRSLGYSPNTTNTGELDAAFKLLKQLKPNIVAFNSTTYNEALAKGDVDVVFGFSAGIIQAKVKNTDLVYAVPDEGAMIWLDSMVIPKGAPNKAEALRYINFILDEKVGAAITTTVATATANAAAQTLLDKKLIGDESIFPPESVLQNAQFVANVGNKISEYERRWLELKR